MPSKAYPASFLSDARNALEGWKAIEPPPTIGDLTYQKLEAALEQSQGIQREIDALEARLTDLRNQRDTEYALINDTVTRLRSGVRGIYGADSSQYEMVGGTRASERRRASAKKKAPKE